MSTGSIGRNSSENVKYYSRKGTQAAREPATGGEMGESKPVAWKRQEVETNAVSFIVCISYQYLVSYLPLIYVTLTIYPG